jgi:hypothetical protein
MRDVSFSTTIDDLFDAEPKLGLQAAAALVPPFRCGRPTNPSTIFRWIKDGVRLPSGKRLHLEGRRIGGRWVTSAGALKRFSDGQTQAHGGQVEAHHQPAPRSPAARQRAARQAFEEIKAPSRARRERAGA